MKNENLISFMRQVYQDLEVSGKLGTAHVYKSTLNVIVAFRGKDYLPFRAVTSEWLKCFENSLRARGCSWNTVSTYMRTLRADRHRALDDEDMKKMFAYLAPENITSGMRCARECFILMFLLRGLPFVDLAYLRKHDLQGNVITYRRRKTGRPLSVTLTPEAMLLLEKYRNPDAASPYLFPILLSGEGTKEAYREYQLALRNFNHQLELLGQLLGLKNKLSSYTARHTWATTAYYCEIHPGIISEAMGHSSITVTETYLKPFKNKKIDEANKQVIDFVKRSVVGINT